MVSASTEYCQREQVSRNSETPRVTHTFRGGIKPQVQHHANGHEEATLDEGENDPHVLVRMHPARAVPYPIQPADDQDCHRPIDDEVDDNRCLGHVKECLQ